MSKVFDSLPAVQEYLNGICPFCHRKECTCKGPETDYEAGWERETAEPSSQF